MEVPGLLAAVVEQTTDAVFVKDLDGRYLLVNSACARILGRPKEEIVGRSDAQILPPEAAEKLAEVDRLVMDTGEASSYEEVIPVDGRPRTFLSTKSVYRDAAGNTAGIIGISRDITERKEAEQELVRREEQFRSLAEGVDFVPWEADLATWRFTYVGPQAAEILGYPPEDWYRDGFWVDRIHPEDRDWVTEYCASKSGSGRGYRFEYRMLGSDGRVVWLDDIVSVVEGGDGTKRLQGVMVDITERKEAEEAQRFLAETGALLSSSLDYRATLTSVARLAVPTLADWCGVDVLAGDGSVERLAVAHEDPARVPLARRLQERYPADPEAPGGLHHVLRTGRPEVYAEVTDAMLEAAARDAEHLELLREIGFGSVVIVPMVARGRTLGAITLVSAEPGRGFGEADLRLAEELARRAATAMDNARLYEEARKEIAERKRAQEELGASRDQLEVILRGVADGVTAQDATGHLIYANEAAASLVGFPSAREFLEAPTREVMAGFEVFDEEGRPFPLANLPGRRALSGEEGAEEVLRFRVLATGEERWSVVRAEPVFDERGGVRLAVNIFRDVTESRRAAEAMSEVRQAERQRMARDLHDGVLQDLSYTSAAIGLVSLQIEDKDLQRHLQGITDAIRRAGQGLREAVNDLRLEEELGRPFPELVGTLVEEARAMDPGCEFRLEVREGFPQEPLGEAGVDLSRLIREALTNARRHSGAGSVDVALLTEGKELVADVSDDGRGLGQGAEPGMGTRSMTARARRLGGELAVESAPGRGTRVRARVPMHVAPRGDRRGEAGPDGTGGTGR
jgi:PAS domain S-box-containing protein